MRSHCRVAARKQNSTAKPWQLTTHKHYTHTHRGISKLNRARGSDSLFVRSAVVCVWPDYSAKEVMNDNVMILFQYWPCVWRWVHLWGLANSTLVKVTHHLFPPAPARANNSNESNQGTADRIMYVITRHCWICVLLSLSWYPFIRPFVRLFSDCVLVGFFCSVHPHPPPHHHHNHTLFTAFLNSISTHSAPTWVVRQYWIRWRTTTTTTATDKTVGRTCKTHFHAHGAAQTDGKR
jgi:hypothetical protein